MGIWISLFLRSSQFALPDSILWCLKATIVSVNQQQHCTEVYQFIYGPIVSVMEFPKTCAKKILAKKYVLSVQPRFFMSILCAYSFWKM